MPTGMAYSEAPHQKTYLPSHMLDFVALAQHKCQKPSSFACVSFTRLASMLQYHVLNVALNQQHICCGCIQPTGTSDTIKLDQHACLFAFHLPADTYVCLNQLQLTYKHICSFVAEPAGSCVTLASYPQLCPYARTQLTGW